MLSAAPLGLNTAPWDYVNAANTSAGGGVDIIQPLLKAASVDMLRVNARQFLIAMKAADPSARIGVPWAFSSEVPGASVPDNAEWNNTVLGTDGKYVSFVDAHYYPFFFAGSTGGANPTDQQVLRALFGVPALYPEIRASLDL